MYQLFYNDVVVYRFWTLNNWVFPLNVMHVFKITKNDNHFVDK